MMVQLHHINNLLTDWKRLIAFSFLQPGEEKSDMHIHTAAPPVNMLQNVSELKLYQQRLQREKNRDAESHLIHEKG